MITASATVEADLNYLRNTGQRPVNYTYDPPPGVPRNSGEVDTRRVTIRNARLASPAGDLSLDRSGFQLVKHRSALDEADDYTSEARIRAVYYPEVESVLRTVTGAQKVLVFDHTLRDGTPDHGRAGVREPVRRVHDDQTFESAPRRVPRHLSKDEADLRLKRRFAIVNFWRPIGEPVRARRWPSAMRAASMRRICCPAISSIRTGPARPIRSRGTRSTAGTTYRSSAPTRSRC